MTDQANLDLFWKLNDAFKQGDLVAMAKLWHEDAIWHSAGTNWLVGDYSGVENIMKFFEAVHAYSEGSYETQVHDVLSNERRVVSLQRSIASRTDGRHMSVDAVIVLDVVDGKIKEAWASPWNLYEEDHFYGLTPPPGLPTPQKHALAGPHYWHAGRAGVERESTKIDA